MEKADKLDFLKTDGECDLIMRGGITSGVVFPKAITRLATRYSFFNIGGTSAGSIAAIMAAAAEYRRETGKTDEEKEAGFRVIDGMAEDLATNLRKLFQPSAGTRSLFEVAMAMVESKGRFFRLLMLLTQAYARRVVLGLLIGIVFVLVALFLGNFWAGALGLLLMFVLPPVLVLWPLATFIWNSVARVLPLNQYGLCTGLRQEGSDSPGFTEWMADKLDEVAGLDKDSGNYKPLTAGDLKINGQKDDAQKPRITVASVTTDLSSRRPYQLPLDTRIFSFRAAEFEALFPPRILNYLKKAGGPLTVEDGKVSRRRFIDLEGNEDYYKLPVGDDFPILLVARLSLSFPGLISAVPLYRFDFTLDEPRMSAGAHMRCLFSDGGITSNFPIHFFDALIPKRPTFGISLGSYEERRFKGNPKDKRKSRIFLSQKPRDGSGAPAYEINRLTEFASAILTTARNWQDTLQSSLHGYRERIVEIRLDDAKEGGLNLNMSPQTIKELGLYGEYAGEEILSKFRFDEHRWRRAVTTFPVLQDAFDRFDQVWGEEYRKLILTHETTGFALSSAEREKLVEFGDEVAELGRKYRDVLPRKSAQRANLRVVASIATDDQDRALSSSSNVSQSPPPRSP